MRRIAFTALSFALHVGILAAVHGPATEAVGASDAEEPVFLEIIAHDDPAEPPVEFVEPPPLPDAPVPPEPPEPRPVAATDPTPVVSTAAAVSAAFVVPAVEGPPTLNPTVEPTPDRAVPQIDLSASAVARAATRAERSIPMITADDIERRLERELDQRLGAATRTRHTSRRPAPELERDADGNYRFAGHLFAARIAPDGTVSFSDRAGFETAGSPTVLPSAEWSFDISDAVERRRGADPYAAERRWFLAETEELRDRLARETWDAAGPRRRARLRADLGRILRTERTPRDRRLAIFRVWDGCSDDEVGLEARQHVEAFIRERLPQDDPDAYPAAELRELNRHRDSGIAFDPYR